jgi:hypothetical protein
MELTAGDLQEIHNLIAGYVLAVDARDLELFESLWIPHAVVDANRDHVGLGFPLHGRETIVAAFACYFERGVDAPPGTFSRHFCTSTRIEVVDGEVGGTTAMLSVRQELRDGLIVMGVSRTGTYTDRFAQSAERWGFASRLVAWDPPERAGIQLPVDLYGPVVTR